jgi:hypothetical protein
MSALFSLTPTQQLAMDVIRAAPAPITRFGLSKAMGRDKGFGYRMAERLAERGHVRLTDRGIVAVALRAVPGFADHSPPPTVRKVRQPIAGGTRIARFRRVRNGSTTFLMLGSSKS